LVVEAGFGHLGGGGAVVDLEGDGLVAGAVGAAQAEGFEGGALVGVEAASEVGDVLVRRTAAWGRRVPTHRSRAAAWRQSGQDRVVVVIRIDHVQLAMPAGREDEATAFYEGLLGIPRVPKPAHLAARGGCWFEAGDLKVHLGVEADFRAASKAHPAFVVGDVRTLARELAAAGCEVVEDEPLEGHDRVFVADPFGNRIELLQPLPPIDR
jgi:catechol 2,3-dioxygenase-like lactoylglutathione lyase family enzyme